MPRRSIPNFSMLHAEKWEGLLSEVIIMITSICMKAKGGGRVKVNTDEQKVSELQGTAHHDLL